MFLSFMLTGINQPSASFGPNRLRAAAAAPVPSLG